MDYSLLFYIIAALVVVLGAGFGLRTLQRRREQLPPAPTRPEIAASTEPQESEPEPASQYETPESLPGRMQRLRSRLAGSGSFGRTVLSVLSRGNLSEADWEEIEDSLLTADLGLEVTTELMDKLRTQLKVLDTSDPATAKQVLRQQLLELVGPDMDRSLNLEPTQGTNGEPAPAVILMVGVNGTGKTTTCGKLARVLVAVPPPPSS